MNVNLTLNNNLPTETPDNPLDDEKKRAEIAQIHSEAEKNKAEVAQIQTEEDKNKAEIAQIHSETEKTRRKPTKSILSAPLLSCFYPHRVLDCLDSRFLAVPAARCALRVDRETRGIAD